MLDNHSRFSVYDNRVADLAKKICDLYSVTEIDGLTQLSSQTIKRWGDKKHRPSRLSVAQLGELIRVSLRDLDSYLDGQISLDELWGLRGSANRVMSDEPITLSSVVIDAKLLPVEQQIQLMMSLLESIKPHPTANNNH